MQRCNESREQDRLAHRLGLEREQHLARSAAIERNAEVGLGTQHARGVHLVEVRRLEPVKDGEIGGLARALDEARADRSGQGRETWLAGRSRRW